MKFLLILTLSFFVTTLYAEEKLKAIHTGITVANENEAIDIYLNVRNSYLANEIYLNYKVIDEKTWNQIVMFPKDGRFFAEIPKNKVKGTGVNYYISVLTLDEENIDIFASKNTPQFIKLKENKNQVFLKLNDDKNTDKNTEEEDFFENEFEVFIGEEEVKVKLASGKEESLFDSPLSASVLTRKEIKNAGATSIPEALRLFPGVIVREQTSGNYDIHIRGFDAVPLKSYLPFSSNSTTLLMINNRIIYNYTSGGIYWDAIPIDINDVERIEIVRGGASAMYGPNAASGVINIITRDFKKEQKEGSFASVTMSKGDTTDFTDSKKGDVTIVNGIVGYKKDKISVIVSGNYSERKRPNTQYWAWRNGEDADGDGIPDGDWADEAGDIKSVDNDDKTMDEVDYTSNQFPNQELALRRYGFNIYMSHHLRKNITFDLDLGGQSSHSQKAFQETLDSFLTGTNSNNQYARFKASVYDTELQISYKEGEDIAYNYPSFTNRSKILNTNLKYDFNYKSEFGDLSITPLISYNNISYFGKGFGGEKPAEAIMENIAASLRLDYTAFNMLRLIAAGRVDKYAHNDKLIYTYQFATTVKLAKLAIFRAVYSRANRNPFMSDTFYKVRNLNVDEPRVFLGNPDLDVLTMDTAEIGLRLKFSKIVTFDLEAFYVTGKNYDDLTFTGDIVVIDGVSRAKLTFENMSLIAKQMGITANLDFNMGIVNLKLFGTIQKTDIENYNDSFLMNPDNKDLQDLEHKSTPKFYGGAYLNIKAMKKLNININPYYYTSQTYIHTLGTYNINSKFILNAKINYDLTKKLSIYFNGRNILNDKSREFGYADEIGGLYLIGMNINY